MDINKEIISVYKTFRCQSKMQGKTIRKVIYLNIPAFLIQKQRKETQKLRFLYHPEGLRGTWRFCFNNTVILRGFLSRAEIKGFLFPFPRWSNNIQDKSCIFLTLCIVRGYRSFETVTSQFFIRTTTNNVNKGLMNVLKTAILRTCFYCGSFLKNVIDCGNRGRAGGDFFAEKSASVPVKNSAPERSASSLLRPRPIEGVKR